MCDSARHVQPAVDLWLRQLDLMQENVDQLIDAEAHAQDAGAVPRDLAAVKELLCASAGSLQACFVAYEFQARPARAAPCVRWHLAPSLAHARAAWRARHCV